MDVIAGFIADSANISGEGKLNVLGVFDVLFSQNFPFTCPQLSLALCYGITGADAGTQKIVEIQFRGEDGAELTGKLQAILHVPPAPIVPRATVWQAVNLQLLSVPKEGSYEFCISVDSHQAFSVPLRAQKLIISPQGDFK